MTWVRSIQVAIGLLFKALLSAQKVSLLAFTRLLHFFPLMMNRLIPVICHVSLFFKCFYTFFSLGSLDLKLMSTLFSLKCTLLSCSSHLKSNFCLSMRFILRLTSFVCKVVHVFL